MTRSSLMAISRPLHRSRFDISQGSRLRHAILVLVLLTGGGMLLVNVVILLPHSKSLVPKPIIPGMNQREHNVDQRHRRPIPFDEHNEHQHDHFTDTTPAADSLGKGPVLQLLHQAGADLTDSTLLAKLPTWEQIVDQYGDRPVIVKGVDGTACQRFQAAVPEVRRMLGAAGMFSTGTNLVTQLLKRNCQIPARVAYYGVNATREQVGMRWQVPWGKHTPLQFRGQHATTTAQDIIMQDVLPVVTIRNPWRWMQSICRNPYTIRWPHYKQCPNLKRTYSEWNNVTVKFGAGAVGYQSLVHVYNDWYREYLEQSTTVPWIMVRMEDLTFYPKATITQVCECAGGRIRDDRPFQLVADSAKADSPGHDVSIGLTEAYIKYSRPLQIMAGFAPDDYAATMEALDAELMDLFGYNHPKSTT